MGAIILINPPWFEGSTFDEFIKKTPPLGLAYLAAVLENDGFSNIRIIDMKAEEINFNELKEKIIEIKPIILGISITTGQVTSAIKIIKIAKEINPGILCVIGGPHPSALPERTLEETDADVCVFGEGEQTFVELTQAAVEGREFDLIKGIVFKKDGLVKKNPPRPLIKDINSLPFPARHLLKSPKEYSKGSRSTLTDIETAIITSRGCPFRCAFCDKSVFARTIRARNAKNVVDEVELLVNKYNVTSLRFFDDLFTVIQKRHKEICNELRRRGLEIKWSCSARVDTVNPEMLKTMKEAGCVEINYGIESGNQDILDLQQKDITLEQIRQAIKWTNEAGIKSGGGFVLGLPGDTKETIKQTIKFAKSLNLSDAGFFFFVPYPGNFERKYRLEDYGRIMAKTWDEYTVFEKPSFIPNGMTEKEFIKLYRWAYLAMYLNSRSIFKLLKRIKDWTILKSYFKAFFWSLGFKAPKKF